MKNKKFLIITLLIIICIVISVTSICIYIYIDSNKNLDLLKINDDISSLSIYQSSNLEDINIDNVSDIFGIDKSYIKDVVGKIPIINIDSSMYVIIKTDKENIKYVQQKLVEYATVLENEWKDYLESKYDLVVSRKIGVKSNYVYLVISNDNKQVIDLIK